jgi:acetate kinase
MRVLALNAGSSSLKVAVVDSAAGRHVAASIEREVDDHDAALGRVLATLRREGGAALEGVEAVGHRIVHGGTALVQPRRIDAAVEAAIEACIPLAPLHNPPGLAVLRAMRARAPALAALPQVAVFDTAFHATLPESAWRYALPPALADAEGLRRFGFHGLSHANVMRRSAEALGLPPASLRIVSAHLGAGGSVTAIDRGRSVDTSMGMTPLEGLVMATRAGDLDPGLLLHLATLDGWTPARLQDLLHHGGGLRALAGTGEFEQVERRAAAGDADCARALDVYVHRLRRYLGAMAAVLGGVDAIAFTGGIGEHSATVRQRVAAGLGFLGAQLDPEANAAAVVSAAAPIARISIPSSAVRLLVVAADEERVIAEDVAATLSGRSGGEWAS